MRVAALEEHFSFAALVVRIDPDAIRRHGFRATRAPRMGQVSSSFEVDLRRIVRPAAFQSRAFGRHWYASPGAGGLNRAPNCLVLPRYRSSPA